MKPFKLLFVSVLISFLSIQSLEAQLLKKLKKRVQEATEDVIAEKVAEKAQQETGKVMDSLLEIDPEYESNYQQQLNELMMMGGSENIPIEDSYSFNTKVTYQLTTTSNNKPTIVDYEMWFPENSGYMATKVKSNPDKDSKDMPGSVVSILDDENQAMVILIEAQKIAQLLSMSKIKNVAEKDKLTGSDSDLAEFEKIQKTGKSKNILGYHCEEFSSHNETNKFSFWVTKDIELFQKNMFFNLSKSLGGNTFDYIPENAKGFMMEMHFENLSDMHKGSMTVKNIENIDKTIMMNEYQLMSLGQFMMD